MNTDFSNITIPTQIEAKHFWMNPETEDLIPGARLKNGMVVMNSDNLFRGNPERLTITGDEEVDERNAGDRDRMMVINRWCMITELRRSRQSDDSLHFIGVYADGTKRSRSYNISYDWYVTLDSLKTVETPREVDLDNDFADLQAAIADETDSEEYYALGPIVAKKVLTVIHANGYELVKR